MNRRDWLLWRLHIIKRGYVGEREYGVLLWGKTVDFWCGHTLVTFRWVGRV